MDSETVTDDINGKVTALSTKLSAGTKKTGVLDRVLEKK